MINLNVNKCNLLLLNKTVHMILFSQPTNHDVNVLEQSHKMSCFHYINFINNSFQAAFL